MLASAQGSPSIDETDRRILGALLADPTATVKALAHRLGLAESTTAYRIRSLHQRGVIRGNRLDVDLAALGRPLEAIVKVRLQSHSQDLVSSLYDDLVAVADAGALRDLVLDHITVHRVVRSTETQLVFEMREGTALLPGP